MLECWTVSHPKINYHSDFAGGRQFNFSLQQWKASFDINELGLGPVSAVFGPVEIFKSCIRTEDNFLTECHYWRFHQLDFYPIFLFGPPRHSFVPATQEKANRSFSKHLGSLKSEQNQMLSLYILHLICTQTLLGQRRRQGADSTGSEIKPRFHYYINETIHRWHILSCLDVFHWIQRLISSTGLSLYSFTVVLSHAAGNGRLTRMRSGCCRGSITDKNKNTNEMDLKDSRTLCC